MAKVFKIELNGQEREVRFGQPEAETLVREFPEQTQAKGLANFLVENVLGFAEVDDPEKVGHKKFVHANRFDPRARRIVIYLALRRVQPKLGEQLVTQWLEKFLEDGGNSLVLALPAVKAAFYSGAVNGERVDLDESLEEFSREVMGEGKETPPEEAAPAPVAAVPAAQ